MKGASLVVYVNEDGEVIGARNVKKETGEIGDDNIQYGPDEIKANKKFVGGNHKTRLLYTNPCCWKWISGIGWVCGPC